MTQTTKNIFIVALVTLSDTYQPIFSDEDGIMIFNTEQDAQAEIDEHIADSEEAVVQGYLDTANDADDYKVLPATYDLSTNTISCTVDGVVYGMDRKDDDFKAI